jgi:hypothetical protein
MVRLGRQLGLLAIAGMGGRELAALTDVFLEMSGLPRLKAEDRKFLAGDIIVHAPGGWSNDLSGHPINQRKHPGGPKLFDYDKHIYAERVLIALGLPAWRVGPIEVSMVMYAATLQAPLNSTLSDIYIWASSHAASRQFGRGSYLDVQVDALLRDEPSWIFRHETDEKMLTMSPWKGELQGLWASIRRKVEASASK